MSVLDSFILKKTEQELETSEPEISSSNLPENDLKTLRNLYRIALQKGYAHHHCKSNQEAQEFCSFLNENLPENLECWVINLKHRNHEINVYTVEEKT